MSKRQFAYLIKQSFLFSLVLSLITGVVIVGCGALEDYASAQLEDLTGWDLSACVESSAGRETCFELFLDNQSRILGGSDSVTAIFNEMPKPKQ